MTTTTTTWVIQVRDSQGSIVAFDNNPFGLWFQADEVYASDDVEQMLRQAVTLQENSEWNYRYHVIDQATLGQQAPFVVQVTSAITGEPMSTGYNPHGLWSNGNVPMEYATLADATAEAERVQRGTEQFHYRAKSLAEAEAYTVQARSPQPNVPDTQPAQGERQPQIVAGDEGVAEAIRQHEADLATISVDMAEQARRRGWCAEYEGVLRGINAGLYRPLLTGREGYDTTPRRDRAARALITPGTIQNPDQAGAWGIWYTMGRNVDGGNSGWLTEDGHERHAYTTREAAIDRAEEMRRSHSDCTYTVIPIPDVVMPFQDVRIAYNGRDLTTGEAQEMLNSQDNRLTALRQQMASNHQMKDTFLQALSEALYEEDEDLATRVINSLNDRQPHEFRIPLNEQEYLIHGTTEVTITMSVPVSFTVMAASREDAEEIANEQYSDYVSSDDVGEHLRYNMGGREAYDAWDGDWDGFEVNDIEESG